MKNTLDQWFQLAERSTSGDMVSDILYDWKEEVERLKEENEHLKRNRDKYKMLYEINRDELDGTLEEGNDKDYVWTNKAYQEAIAKKDAEIDKLTKHVERYRMVDKWALSFLDETSGRYCELKLKEILEREGGR